MGIFSHEYDAKGYRVTRRVYKPWKWLWFEDRMAHFEEKWHMQWGYRALNDYWKRRVEFKVSYGWQTFLLDFRVVQMALERAIKWSPRNHHFAEDLTYWKNELFWIKALWARMNKQ